MSFFGKMRDWLSANLAAEGKPAPPNEMQEAMEMARLAKHNENYDRALGSLDRAMHLADEAKDTYSVAVIALHQADILILQGKYDEAESLLQTVQQTAEASNQAGFLSYSLSSLGTLRQKQGEWDEAREAYEQARSVAKRADNVGAEARATGHLADIYLHEDNASYAVHLLQECLPMLNQGGDLELSSYFVGRLGEAMIANGQPEEGYKLLDRALRLAERMRDKRMTRRWSLAVAQAAYQQSGYQEAYMFYKRALPMFEATPTPDYIQSLTRTADICLNLGQPEEALTYAKQAVQVAEAGTDESLRAQAEAAYGAALRANRRYAEAVPYLQAALQRTEAQPVLRANLLRQLASAQAASGVPGALESYQRGLEWAQQHDLSLPSAELHRDLGLYYIKLGQPLNAIDQWAQALSIFEAQDDHNQVARLYCDTANARRQLGQGRRAIRDFEQALIRLNNVNDVVTRGLVLSNAANAYADQGDTDSAASFFKESIEIARQVGDVVAQSTRLGNYGWFLLSTGEPRQAIERLTEALEISESQNMPLQAAVQTDNIGLAYDVLSQYKTALGYHEQAQAKLDELDSVPQRWQAMISANTGKTLLALSRIDAADDLFEQALTLARAAEDFEVLAGVLIGKARLLLTRDEPQAADAPLTEAITIARKADMRRLLAEALTARSEQQAALGDEAAARATWDDAKRLFRMVGGPQAKQTAFWLGNTPPDATP